MQAQDRLNDIKSRKNKQAAMFVGHGSPMVAIEFDDWNDKVCSFVEGIPQPTAIVIMSAHWETEDGVHILSARLPDQKYDFPPEDYPDTLMHLTYPCEGQPKLARDIADMLSDRGYTAILDEESPMDHGAWIPLYVTFPNVDVPVVEISLPKNASPEKVLDMGRTLASLRKRGILIMGSGNIVNNKHFADLKNKYADTENWAEEVDQWFSIQLAEMNLEELLAFKTKAPHAEKAISDTSHILPLFFVLGTLQQDDYYINLYEGFHYANISMRSFALASNN